MKFIFIVQGEGRGHMTQAISMSQLLEKNNHEICAVCIGKSHRREIPDFFSANIKATVHLFDSPNFETDKNQKGIKIGKTISSNLFKISRYKKSLREIHRLVIEHRPDIILNFYDLLGGLYNAIYQPDCRYWTIGHQYLIDHPQFPFPKRNKLAKFLFRLNTKVTALGSELELALSFRPLYPLQSGKTIVMPPLLRNEVRKLSATTGSFYLTYMVNAGYLDEMLTFAKKYPEVEIEVFCDKKDVDDKYEPLKNVNFHQLNDRLFLEKMAQCKGLITTAGFESVCESMYFGKPVMMIPVKGHFEQLCNALDAKHSGAGIISGNFDFIKMQKFINSGDYNPVSSKDWTDSFEEKFYEVLGKQPVNSLFSSQKLVLE